MKIFPSTHNIKSITDKHVDLDLNIPLAYIEMDYTKYTIDKVMEDIVSKDEKKEVLYNQSFTSSNIKLFNKFGEAVNMDNLLTRVGDLYYYRPKDIITFKPQTFKYNVTIKKKLDYKISNSYNINIACVDDPDSEDLSKRIAAGFSNPSTRELTPPNIIINNNRIDAQTFTDMNIEDCDILFIESPDGKYYDNSTDPILIDKEMFLKNNTIIWLASDFNTEYPHENDNGGSEYQIANPILNIKSTINCNTYFRFDALPYNPNIIYHNIFTTNKVPIVIIEHIGQGYEILSHSSILKDITNNINILYECILYCYLNGYKKTTDLTQWICSEVPDYQIESGKLIKKKYFLSDIDIYKYFNLTNSELDIYSVNITDTDETLESRDSDLYEPSSTIYFIGMNGGQLMFNQVIDKNSIYNNEPNKPTGWISIYDGTNVMYLKELHYTIETNLQNKIFTSISDDDLLIRILSFKSSSLGLNLQIPIDKTISFIKTEVNKIERIRQADYLFYINLNNQEIDYTFKEDYTEDKGIALFTIKVHQTPEAVNITDMRQLGGGLVEDIEDNYNLMDIGHINGRPYRKTGTLVFTLPIRYKEYEDIILKAINKYISASDMPVILFEDKDNEEVIN